MRPRLRHRFGEGTALYPPTGTGSAHDAVLGEPRIGSPPRPLGGGSGSTSAAISARVWTSGYPQFDKKRQNRNKEMPKIKTNRGAAKRFKRNASGTFKRNASHRRHILTKKSSKRKRHLRDPEALHKADVKSARRMIPYC